MGPAETTGTRPRSPRARQRWPAPARSAVCRRSTMGRRRPTRCRCAWFDPAAQRLLAEPDLTHGLQPFDGRPRIDLHAHRARRNRQPLGPGLGHGTIVGTLAAQGVADGGIALVAGVLIELVVGLLGDG